MVCISLVTVDVTALKMLGSWVVLSEVIDPTMAPIIVAHASGHNLPQPLLYEADN